MNKLIIAFITSLSLLSAPVHAAAEKKKVCHEETDKKGKKKEVCKEVKVHKKLEGAQKPSEVKPDSKK